MVIYTVFENYKKMYPILTCSNCAEIDRLEINTYFVVSLYISPQIVFLLTNLSSEMTAIKGWPWSQLLMNVKEP